eukprot:jgi/Galph1/3812/GphlegSOOS_G2491.1
MTDDILESKGSTVDIEKEDLTLPIAILATLPSALDDQPFFYLKNVSFSPDGSELILTDVSNFISIYRLPETLVLSQTFDYLQYWNPFILVNTGEYTRDVDWFPAMTTAEPATCAFLTCCRDHPVHLWDALTGIHRCSYCAYNHNDELVGPHSVRFSVFGDSIFCGFASRLRVFDTQRPGRDCDDYSLHNPRGQGPSVRGIISSIDQKKEETDILALGSFSGTVSLCDLRMEKPNMIDMCLSAHNGGVTMVRFAAGSSSLLLAGARKDDDIAVWDIRNPSHVLYRLERQSRSNQRIGFDIDATGQYVYSGGTDGVIRLWSLETGELLMEWYGSQWSIGSVSLHLSGRFLATCSGERNFQLGDSMDDVSGEEETQSLSSTRRKPMDTNKEHFVYRNKVLALWYMHQF